MWPFDEQGDLSRVSPRLHSMTGWEKLQQTAVTMKMDVSMTDLDHPKLDTVKLEDVITQQVQRTLWHGAFHSLLSPVFAVKNIISW